jgi:hypothetical protein
MRREVDDVHIWRPARDATRTAIVFAALVAGAYATTVYFGGEPSYGTRDFVTDNLTVTNTTTTHNFNEPPCVVPDFVIGAGPFNDWNPACLATNKLLKVTCADNNGTFLTGIDAVDNAFPIGKEVTVCNENATEDDGACVFGIENTGSVASNRIWYGTRTGTLFTDRFRVDTGQCATFRYAQPNSADPTIKRWVVESVVLGIYRTKIQNLSIFPFAQPAAITGTVEDWSPTPCAVPLGGSCPDGGSTDFADYSLVIIPTVDATGATIGGMDTGPGANSGKNEGQIKILHSGGPGPLTIIQQSGGSLVKNRFFFPTNSDNSMVIPVGQDRIFWTTGSGWTLIGSQFSGIDTGKRTVQGPMQVADHSNASLADVGIAYFSVTPTGTGLLPASSPAYVIEATTDGVSYDTTAAAAGPFNFVALAHATRSAGANLLLNTGVYSDATGGTINRALTTQGGGVYTGIGGDPNTFYDNHVYIDENKGIKAEGIGAGGLEVALTVCGGDFNGNTQSQVVSAIAPTANHCTVSTDASNFMGRLTSCGANSSVTLTFGGGGFGTTSHCWFNASSATVRVYTSTFSNTAPVFSCVDGTGTAQNCPDFEYQCWGH